MSLYAAPGANRRQLPGVTRFLAQLRADRQLFAAARFIGRVDSGTQIIVFGAAGTAMPASRVGAGRQCGPWRWRHQPTAGYGRQPMSAPQPCTTV